MAVLVAHLPRFCGSQLLGSSHEFLATCFCSVAVGLSAGLPASVLGGESQRDANASFDVNAHGRPECVTAPESLIWEPWEGRLGAALLKNKQHRAELSSPLSPLVPCRITDPRIFFQHNCTGKTCL